MSPEIIYQAETENDCRNLERLMKLFLENYDITCKGKLCARINYIALTEDINISPDKDGIIKGVSQVDSEPVSGGLNGELVSSDPNGVVLFLDTIRYTIRYNPEKKK